MLTRAMRSKGLSTQENTDKNLLELQVVPINWSNWDIILKIGEVVVQTSSYKINKYWG